MKIAILWIILIFSLQCKSEEKGMAIKSKNVKESQIDQYIDQHKGKLTQDTVLLSYSNAPERAGYLSYYEFDNDSLLCVTRHLVGRQAILYDSKEKYVKDLVDILDKQRRTPLGKRQAEIKDIPNNVNALIAELYLKLKLENVPVNKLDFKAVDHAIKKYGYQQAFDDLYLNLIIVAGENIKLNFGGSWVVETSPKNELVPIFIDDKNYRHRLHFWIVKGMNEDGRFSMDDIMFTETHRLQTSPNPSLTHPNK